MSVYLLTCATNPNTFEYNIFNNFANKYKYNVVNGGVNLTWENSRTKLIAFCNGLKLMNQDSYCVACDGYDVLPVKDPSTLIQDYKKINKKIIVGADNQSLQNTRPLVTYWQKNENGIYNYVNTGFLFGKVKDLFTLCKNLLDKNVLFDQSSLSEYIDQNADDFYLDVNADFVLNSVVRDYEVVHVDNIISNESLNGQKQYFIHFPGLTSHEDQQLNYQTSLNKLLPKYNLKGLTSTRNVRSLPRTAVYFMCFILFWAIIATGFAFYYYNKLFESTKI